MSLQGKRRSQINVRLLDDVGQPDGSDFMISAEQGTTPSGERDLRTSIPSRVGLPQCSRSWLDPREARPNESFYRKDSFVIRPSITLEDQLAQNGQGSGTLNYSRFSSAAVFEGTGTGLKDNVRVFGTWDGVFVRCLLNIFGAIMFLRLPWIIGQAGIIQSIIIITLGSFVVFLTTLSMSAISTNGEIATGGAYYMISRALGPGIGGAIGILFTIGNAIAVSMYLIAFCETLRDNLYSAGIDYITGSREMDVRVYCTGTLVLQFLMTLGGMSWIIKIQMFLMFLIAAAIVCTVIGAFVEQDVDKLVYGIDGWRNETVFHANLYPEYSKTEGIDYSFFSVFAVFFPAVTGIMSGANISGELKDPGENIPKGTLWSVGVSWVVYCCLAVIIGGVAGRGRRNCSSCLVGLLNDYYIMEYISLVSYLILAGVYAATFSSALASLVGAPRILQALAIDELIPSLSYFKKARANGDPIRGYVLTFVIVFGVNMIGNLNLVAPLITQFFMMTYTLINFSCFYLSWSKSPGWRPAFYYYNKWTALLGAISCIGIQFLIQWEYALAACAIGMGLYAYIEFVIKPDVNWGSAIEARQFTAAYDSVMRLEGCQEHIKNYRPNYLVLSGDPKISANLDLIYFAQTFRHNYGPIIYGNVKIGDYRRAFNLIDRDDSNIAGHGYLKQKQPPVLGLYNTVVARSVREGSQMMIQLAGLGRLQTNTLVLGFKEGWNKGRDSLAMSPSKNAGGGYKVTNQEYFGMVQDAIIMKMGVMICRNLNGCNWDWEIQYPRHKRRPRGFIDVWWLLDDGGLTILLPHLLRRHKFWHWMKLRLFVLGPPPSPAIDHGSTGEIKEIERETKRFVDLMKKFRLKWDEEPTIVQIGSPKPKEKTVMDFAESVGQDALKSDVYPDVTSRWLRVSELMEEHRATETNMTIMSLPLPREEISPALYLGLLDHLTREKHPHVLMRGNQQNVLTFYSE